MNVLSTGRSFWQREADTEERGIIDTDAPVSTRNDVLERRSLIKHKFEVELLEEVENEATGDGWDWFSLARWLTRFCFERGGKMFGFSHL